MSAPLRRSSRPRVLSLSAGHVTFEQGRLESAPVPDRLAIVAHYSNQRRVTRSLRRMVQEFSAANYQVIVVSGAPFSAPLEWNGDLPSDAVVIRQPNIGYDFGSWAIGLAAAGAATSAGSVILANDSLIGPFASMHPLLEKFENSGADVWALTDTYQYFHHLQSYFLGFRGGILTDRPLARFWSDIRVEATKWDIIRHNELGLGRLLYQEGYGMEAAYRADDIVAHGENPVIKGWWRLLDQGFPFLKREIVRDPSVAPMSHKVSEEVSAAFGAQLSDWL